MNKLDVKTSNPLYSASLFGAGLIAALLFNGLHIYLLAICWISMTIWFGYHLLSSRNITARIDISTVLAFAFLGWCALSLLWNPSPWQGEYYLWHISLFFFSMLMSRYFLGENDIDKVLSAATLVGLMVALFTLYQMFYLGLPADGPFTNKNINAAFMLLILVPQMSQILLQKGRNRLVIRSSVIFAVIFFSFLQAVSRGALVGLVVAGTLLFIFAMSRKCWKNTIWLSLLIAVVLLVNSVVTPAEINTDLSSPSRWLLWKTSLGMLSDSGWLGFGGAMFAYRYPEYRLPNEMSAGLYAHNDYLQILLELGLPGIVLFSGFISLVLLRARNVLMHNHHADVARVLGLTGALVAILTHSLVTYNFYIAGTVLVLGLYAGILLRDSMQLQPGVIPAAQLSLGKPGKSVAFIATLLFVGPVVSSGYADAIADNFISQRLYLSKPEERYEIYRELWKLDPKNYVYPLNIAYVYSNLGGEESAAQLLSRFNKSRELIHQARELNPYAIESYVAEASLLRRYQNVVGENWNKDAVDLLNRAIQLNPRYNDIWFQTAIFLYDGGNKKRALEVLFEGLTHLYHDDLRYFTYGRDLAVELGNDQAVRKFSALIDAANARSRKQFEEMVNSYKSRARPL